jgi:hypothetical protein
MEVSSASSESLSSASRSSSVTYCFHVFMHVCVRARVCVFVYVCLHGCVYVCMHVCVYVCMYKDVFSCVCKHVWVVESCLAIVFIFREALSSCIHVYVCMHM